MSCVCILTPVVVAAWPAFAAAVTAAADTLGYVVLETAQPQPHSTPAQRPERAVTLEIPNSELVTGQLGRDQRICISRQGVTVQFSRDARGAAAICVSGTGCSEAELRAQGEELSRRVVQKYIHQRLLEEIHARHFVVVEEVVDANQAIRLKVRHWDG